MALDEIKLGVVGDENATWEYVAEKLLSDGISLEIVKYYDYFSPNRALAEGRIDANAFQHRAFLRAEVSEKKYNFEVLGTTYLDPIGIYSKRIKSLSELKEGSSVAIPSDRANAVRALKVLREAGVVDFEEKSSSDYYKLTENRLDISIRQYDAALLYKSLDEVTCSFVNGNYAFDNGLNPATDSIYRETLEPSDTDNDFVKVLVTRSDLDETKRKLLLKVLAYYQTPEVAGIIQSVQGGSLIPAF